MTAFLLGSSSIVENKTERTGGRAEESTSFRRLIRLSAGFPTTKDYFSWSKEIEIIFYYYYRKYEKYKVNHLKN